MNDILKGLSESQKEVVTYTEGPLLVLAGPGAGKTLVLTSKIAYILSNSINERFKILALTFTNKAAKEMRSRVEKFVGSEVHRTFIGTFHGFCYDMLISYGEHIGVGNDFTIYDNNEDLITLLEDALKIEIERERKGENKPTVLLDKYYNTDIIKNTIPSFYYAFVKLKNRLIDSEFVNTDKLAENYSEDFKLIFKLYEKTLKEQNILDFSDLILKANKLFHKKFIIEHIRQIYKYIMIDEGQDTNSAQFELIKIICGDNYKNLFIVADEDQLLYEWNDAKFEYLLELCKKYDMKILQINESFRCPSKVVELANKLIENNNLRIENKKPICSGNGISDEDSFEFNEFDSQAEEVEFVKEKIVSLLADNNNDIGRVNLICVIGRNKYILDEINNKLNEANIPHFVPMLQEKIATREMNFILNLLKLISNENDKTAYFKICEFLNFNYQEIQDKNIGYSLLEGILNTIDRNKYNKIYAILYEFIQEKKKYKEYFDKLSEFFSSINDVNGDNFRKDKEFINNVYDRFVKEGYYSNNLSDFLNFLALSSKNGGKGVAILTGHASKGLEFDYVFIVSLNQGIWPDYRSLKNDDESHRMLEEERRNCYVALTRTKKKLFISCSKYRITYSGQKKHVDRSQFLNEMGLI